MLPLYRTKSGEKLYPVCSWEENQHKLYNAYDRVMNSIYDGKADYSDLKRIEKALSAFESHVINGMVYATWPDRELICDFVAAYDVRH